MFKVLAVCLAVASPLAFAADPYVPPPAPQVVPGEPVKVERETSGSDYVIHIERKSAATQRVLGDYIASLTCTGQVPFHADLSTRTFPFGSPREELIFIGLPNGLDSQCKLTILDHSGYPWKRVFEGTVASIPAIKGGT